MCVLVVGTCLMWNVSASPVSGLPTERHKIRHHIGCNFRSIRDLLRRACAYHSSENQLLRPHADTKDLASISSTGEYHETGRFKQEEELKYIRAILKECCPHDKCPPISKFCR